MDALPAVRLDLPLGGMTCAACAASIEKSLNQLPGVAASPQLRLTEKVNLAASFDYSKRDYLSDPLQVLAQARTDWVRTAAVKTSYRPLRAVTLELTLLRQTRSSTAVFGDYAVNIANFNARFAF